MTKQELIEVIKANVNKGTTICSISMESEPDMNKTGNPYFGKVKKCQVLNGILGFDYGANVNALAEKEGKEARETKKRAWGVITNDRLFIAKVPNGEPTHLRVRVMKVAGEGPIYVDDNGNPIEKKELAPFLKKSNKSSVQSDLNGEVIERDIKLENIRAITMKEKTFVI